MTDGEDVERRTFELLRDSVRAELAVQNGMGRLGLTDKVIDRLAEAVAVNVDYAFAVRWSPDWVKVGDLHRWSTDDGFFSRCPECLVDSPPSVSALSADVWIAAHRRTEHGG